MRDLTRLANVTANFNKKVQQAELNASDSDMQNVNNVWLSAYKVLGENSSRLILASTSEITEPQARMAVSNLTGQEMTAYAASFTPIKTEDRAKLEGSAEIHYASIIGIKPEKSYRLATNEVMAKCRVLSGLQYLDTELDNVWEKQEIGGKPYLVRTNESNPEEVLKATLLAKTDVSYRNSADNFITTSNAKVGDYAYFFGMTASADDKLEPFMEVAKITSNNGDNLEVEIEENGFKQNAMISAHAVKNIITAGVNTTRQDVIDYLCQAYGPRFLDILKSTGAFGVNSNGKV